MIVNPVFYLILNSLLRLCVIMPASACSWMWQWVSQISGCSGTKPILTLSLGNSRTISRINFSIAYLITFQYPVEYFVDEHRVKPRATVIENDFLGYTIGIINLVSVSPHYLGSTKFQTINSILCKAVTCRCFTAIEMS